MKQYIITRLSRFLRREDGVALVEFAMFLPLFLLSFFVIVEFARVFYSYQGAVVGVRDAARYYARVAPAGICVNAGGVGGMLTGPDYNNVGAHPSGRTDAAYQIVWRNMDNETGFLPTSVFLIDVTVLYQCVTGGGYRQEEVPIAIVAADIEIVLPLIGILELNTFQGIIPNGKITHTIIDESRIFGV
jgi:hypothetical protein